MDNIAVIGGGAWGTAFSLHLARIGFQVKLWVREYDLAHRIQEHRINDIFLPGFTLPATIFITDDLSYATDGAEYIFWAVPTQHLRQIAGDAHITKSSVQIALSKGIEHNSWLLPFQILQDVFNHNDVSVLSGPSFAEEVAAGKPTVLVASAKRIELAKDIQHLVSGERLRVYRNSDPLGVSLGGAYKNIIAIATGISDGLGMGHNARAALITRGLPEIVRIGEAIGARRETLFGIAGLGDMVLTCTSRMSRNYNLGFRIGSGENAENILSTMLKVAEGAYSTFGALHLAKIHKLELPIANEVHKILWEKKDPIAGFRSLMSRPLKSEW